MAPDGSGGYSQSSILNAFTNSFGAMHQSATSALTAYYLGGTMPGSPLILVERAFRAGRSIRRLKR